MVVRATLKGSRLGAIVNLGLATGCRMGELLSLRWRDLDGNTLTIERSLEQTKAGLRFKSPKTKHGRRKITLPPSAVLDLDKQRREQLELRMRLGLGKPPADALVFCNHDGSPLAPSKISVQWNRVIRRIPGMPPVTFHSFRHCHASALIKAGVDVLSVSLSIALQSSP